MREIYCVRHALRDESIKDDLMAPLSKRGLEQAEELWQNFSNEWSGEIYSSPCLRAIQTVEPLAAQLEKKIKIKNDLREREVGEWLADFETFTQQQWLDKTYKTKNGEALKEVQNRAIPLFKELLKSNSESFMISSHGTFLSCLFNYLTNGAFGYNEFKEMKMPELYCGVFNDSQELVSLKNKSNRT